MAGTAYNPNGPCDECGKTSDVYSVSVAPNTVMIDGVRREVPMLNLCMFHMPFNSAAWLANPANLEMLILPSIAPHQMPKVHVRMMPRPSRGPFNPIACSECGSTINITAIDVTPHQIFIDGAPRSGSTILACNLHRPEDIAVWVDKIKDFEMSFLPNGSRVSVKNTMRYPMPDKLLVQLTDSVLPDASVTVKASFKAQLKQKMDELLTPRAVHSISAIEGFDNAGRWTSFRPRTPSSVLAHELVDNVMPLTTNAVKNGMVADLLIHLDKMVMQRTNKSKSLPIGRIDDTGRYQPLTVDELMTTNTNPPVWDDLDLAIKIGAKRPLSGIITNALIDSVIDQELPGITLDLKMAICNNLRLKLNRMYPPERKATLAREHSPADNPTASDGHISRTDKVDIDGLQPHQRRQGEINRHEIIEIVHELALDVAPVIRFVLQPVIVYSAIIIAAGAGLAYVVSAFAPLLRVILGGG